MQIQKNGEAYVLFGSLQFSTRLKFTVLEVYMVLRIKVLIPKIPIKTYRYKAQNGIIVLASNQISIYSSPIYGYL